MVERKEVVLALVGAPRVVVGVRMVEREENVVGIRVAGREGDVVGIRVEGREGDVGMVVGMMGEEGVAERVVVVVETTACSGGEESGDGGSPDDRVDEVIVAVTVYKNCNKLLTALKYNTYLY